MDDIYFSSIITKSLQMINSGERFFEGYLTVEVKDKQGEITIVDELYKVLPIWMDRGAPISDTHSNRIIGKGINFAKTIYRSSEGEDIPAIKITGKIHKNYELDNEIWNKIKSGEYRGLSFGGATKANRTPKVMKDGSIAYQLTDLEHYEVAVCKDPAVPLALITDFNPIAKAMASNTEDRDGKMLIKCSKFGCRVDVEKIGYDRCITCGGTNVEDGKTMCQGCHEQNEIDKKNRFNNQPQSANELASYMEDDRGGKTDKKTGDEWMKYFKQQKGLNKVDLSGIETFEGKVEALMDEGKSRESAEKIVGSFTKKDSPTGHDPTQVAQPPDTPREMELEKNRDHSNTGGDTSSMFNQNGAEQRVNSKKTVVGGEVPPQWTGSGSPYPKGERKVIRRKQLIKESKWKNIKKIAVKADMQWRVIELLKDAEINEDQKRFARNEKLEEIYLGLGSGSDADHSLLLDSGETEVKKPKTKLEKALLKILKEGFTYEKDHDPENHVRKETKDHVRKGKKSQSKEESLEKLTDGELEEVEKDAINNRRETHIKPEPEACPHCGKTPDKKEILGQSHGDQSTSARGGKYGDEFEPDNKPLYTLFDESLDTSPKISETKTDPLGGGHVMYNDLEDPRKYSEEHYPHQRSSTRDTGAMGSDKLWEDSEKSAKILKKLQVLKDGQGNFCPHCGIDRKGEKFSDMIQMGDACPNCGGNVARFRKKKSAILQKDIKILKALIHKLKEGTNAANGTSPRGGNFMGTNDTEAFNVRHNGGRKTKRYGKRAEDLGTFQ